MPRLRTPPAGCRLFITAAAVVAFAGHVYAQGTALSVPVDTTKWIGYDGSWSPVNLGIGTQEQGVDLFPSTAGQETLAIGLNGCAGSGYVQCQELRGGLFAANLSTTFQPEGSYYVGLDESLGYSDDAYYGLDTMTLSAVTLRNQIIGVVNSTQYWTGFLGLGATNSTIGSSSVTSFLATLASGEEPTIPGQSYGYTAGASYRGKQVPASLTLGGYDASRLELNDATFSLDANQQPTIAVNSVIMSSAAGSNLTMIGPEYQNLFTIDSTTPFLWLPGDVVDILGNALGLVYNDTLDTFLYPNMSLYTELSQSALSFNFAFTNIPGQPDMLSLTIAGQAFTSRNLSFGFPGLANTDSSMEPIPYFPVRKAANSSQFTLGRVLLQEAYLTVDYDRGNFSLSQALFPDGATNEVSLVDIMRPGSDTSASGSVQLSTAAIIGIAIGVTFLVTLIISGVALYFFRRHYAKKVKFVCKDEPPPPDRTGIAKLIFGQPKWAELPAREYVPEDKPEPTERPRSLYLGDEEKRFPMEASSNEINELPTPTTAAVELPGSSVQAPRYVSLRGKRMSPVELPDSLGSEAATRVREQHPSPMDSAVSGTFLTISSGGSSNGHPSPLSIYNHSSKSTRSSSSKSSTSPMNNVTTMPEDTSRQSSASRGTSREGVDSTGNAGAVDMGLPTRYTVDDSVNVAFDLRQLRGARKASRRRFSFEDEND